MNFHIYPSLNFTIISRIVLAALRLVSWFESRDVVSKRMVCTFHFDALFKFNLFNFVCFQIKNKENEENVERMAEELQDVKIK